MKPKKVILIFSLILSFLILYDYFHKDQDLKNESQQETVSSRSRISPEKINIERVLKSIKKDYPGISFSGNISRKFSDYDPPLDDLDVMEILLAVETEFNTDISQKEIYQIVGEENRNNLSEHLSVEIISKLLSSP